MGDYVGDYYKAFSEGYYRSLDYSSYELLSILAKGPLRVSLWW